MLIHNGFRLIKYLIFCFISLFSYRLFVQTLYSGPIVVQSLLYNRRRNDMELRLTRNNNSGVAKGDDNENNNNEEDLSETISTNLSEDEEAQGTAMSSQFANDDNPTPMIYACATMWHEEEDEMKALFKSIFR